MLKNVYLLFSKRSFVLRGLILSLTMSIAFFTSAQVKLLDEVKISDKVMFFDGVKVPVSHKTNSTKGYDFVYGNALTPHGDCIKAYKNFVFMTWYRGGKNDRHVMLTRYNMTTGVSKTIEFPHQHTGYNGKWWIGETHNTIAVGICPKDESIHLLYDMHRNGNWTDDDYLRYSYSFDGAATVPDNQFTLARFINSPAGNYKHLAFQGIRDVNTTKLLTYPAFFTNDEGDLFMKMRFGYSENGRFLFARFDGTDWEGYTPFNRSNASNYGSQYNWGLYGDFKYLDGKIRIGFQRRSNNGKDKYLYQNGIYYAYSDDPTGKSKWKDHKGSGITFPLADADEIKIAEPGDWVATTQKDKVYMVGGFDFTITEAGDEHFVSTVKDNQFNVTKKLHTYRKAGTSNFTTKEYSAGSELYAAGNDVFVIGLKNGRVNIVKTEGGTNNFVQVYQHTTGPIFDKGVVNVSDGKLYYYLKQAGGSGDKRTTYLQVYDLGLGNINQAPTVNITSPSNNAIVEVGQEITLSASASDPDGNLDKVNFKINDDFYKTVSDRPFEYTFTPTKPGTYKIAALAIDKENAKTEVFVTITVTEKNKAPIASFTTPAVSTMEEGYTELVVTVNASDPNGDDMTVLLKIDGKEIRSESVAPYEWGHEGSPDPSETVGLSVGDHVLEAIVTDTKGLSITISKIILVDKITGTFFLVDRNELIVFPNPSKSGFFQLNKDSEWVVYNLQGKNITSGSGKEINLSSSPKGIYLLKIGEKIAQLIVQ